MLMCLGRGALCLGTSFHGGNGGRNGNGDRNGNSSRNRMVAEMAEAAVAGGKILQIVIKIVIAIVVTGVVNW
jgi:hypothetical protein